ncbi:MAG: cache domain-containing protein [Pseudomonadota bacterium]
MRSCIFGLVVLFAATTGVVTAAAERGTDQEAMAMVVEAVELFDRVGPEATFAAINAPETAFKDRDLFALVWRMDGMLMANGNGARLVGTQRWDFRDAGGTYLTRLIIETATNGGGWVNYDWQDPKTGNMHAKSTYAIALSDEYVIGVGVYGYKVDED